jgi:hypothetical protein
VEAEIFIASVHGALLSARVHGEPKMFGEIIRPVLGRLAKKINFTLCKNAIFNQGLPTSR